MVRARTRRGQWLGYVLIAPLALWLAATMLYPLAVTVRTSVSSVGIIGTGGGFSGWSNYAAVLSSPLFRDAGVRSLEWVVGNAILQTALAFVTALVLNEKLRGRTFARTWIVVSWVVPTVVIAIIGRWMLNGAVGVIQYLLLATHLVRAPVDFFGDPSTAMATTIVINSWHWFPFLAVILLASLQAVPQDYYEAAAIDGASAWGRFRAVTWPALQPTMFVLGLIGTLWSVNIFDVIWLLTQGGPANGTTTLPVYIYEQAFQAFNMGGAAAASMIMGVALFLFAALYLRFAAPREEGWA